MAKIERCKKAALVTDMMSVESRTTPRLQTSGVHVNEKIFSLPESDFGVHNQELCFISVEFE